MKTQKIQTQNYHKSLTTPRVSHTSNKINFHALQLKRAGVTTKTNPSLFMKIGALATAGAVSIKELFFNKVLEVSTVGQIKQNAILFGKSIAENIYQNNGKFNPKEIEKLVLTHLEEEHRKDVRVVTNEADFCNFAEKHMNLNIEYAKTLFQKTAGFAAHGTNGEMVFFLKLDGKEPEVATHIATHEFEHLLYKTSGLMGKLMKKHLSEPAEKKEEETNKQTDSFGENVNKKFFSLQNALAGLLLGKNATSTPFEYVDQEPTIEGILKLSPELTSKKDLDKWLEKYIRQNLIQPNFDESNLSELQGFEIVLRDEARAYDAGGKAQKYYNELTDKNKDKTTMAEMVSVIYTQMANKIQKYKKLIIKSAIKEACGMKPTDYHEPIPKESSNTNEA